MNLNPEFQRQLHLEFSHARLMGVPLILAIIFALTYLVDDYHFSTISAQTALGLFLMIVAFWGARLAVESVLEEQRSHTWDTQRLSALDPWSMVAGKLFGSTLVVWYGGVICLIVYAIAAKTLGNFFWVCSYAVISGLWVQSFCLLLSLVALQKEQVSSNSMIIGFAVLSAFMIASWIMPLAQYPTSTQMTQPTDWYGLHSTVAFLTLISISFALFWCVIGVYRLMAQELRIRTVPWVWLAFAVFLIIYTGGFISAEKFNSSFYITAFSLCVFLSYIALFSESQEPMRIKRLLTYIAQENWSRCAQELPLWSVSFALTAVLAIPLSFNHPADIDELHIYPISILLLLLRDIGIFLYFNYSKNAQRAFSLTLLTLLFLYGVLPAMFHAAKLTIIVALFLPLLSNNILWALVFSVLQTAIVGYLLYNRWRESV